MTDSRRKELIKEAFAIYENSNKKAASTIDEAVENIIEFRTKLNSVIDKFNKESK